MKYTLPISPEYCAHWGLWEAVREIYQNALDAASTDRECEASIEYSEDLQELRICTTVGRLFPKSLVLGNTSKREDQAQRGKFGEGYKIALLVLARENHFVEVFTGAERWETAIERDETFDASVLNIYTYPYTESFGTSFIIDDVTPEAWTAIQANLRPQTETFNTILEDSEEKGRIYVGGLYVSTVNGFQCGYAFRPGVVKLDRDRGMVDGFDLAWQTSQLWTSRGHSTRLSELMESEAPDVQYVESHVSEGSEFANHHYNYYVARHGFDAIPVSNQDEIQRAAAAGKKWVLVPEPVKSILHLVKKWFIPNNQPLIVRLQEFHDKYQYYLTPQARREFEEIIQSLKPEEASCQK